LIAADGAGFATGVVGFIITWGGIGVTDEMGFSDAWGGRRDAADAGFVTGVVGFSDAWDGGGGEVLVWQIAVISLVAVLASGCVLVRR
jgi:hypothetical protein